MEDVDALRQDQAGYSGSCSQRVMKIKAGSGRSFFCGSVITAKTP
jgi:hypothetical protein